VTTMTVSRTTPRRSALPRAEAMRLAATEYRRFAAAVAELGPQDWARRTDCPDWNVHELVAHVVGMAAMASSPMEQSRQRKGALARRTEGRPFIDWLTSHQVDKFGVHAPDELVRLAAAVAPKAVRGRKWAPGFIRRRPMPVPQLVGGVPETWTTGYLVDTILTRDTWMHRVDLAQATGRPMVLTPEHDGAIVTDIVAEWAERHGAPYRLCLTGPAGGTWSAGSAAAATESGDQLTLDAVEFCRLVSGRGTASGLLGVLVPF
jgi:uncharacterized protein (TIGR03083 family)